MNFFTSFLLAENICVQKKQYNRPLIPHRHTICVSILLMIEIKIVHNNMKYLVKTDIFTVLKLLIF